MSAPVILALMSFCFLFFGYLGVPVPFSLMAGVFLGALLTERRLGHGRIGIETGYGAIPALTSCATAGTAWPTNLKSPRAADNYYATTLQLLSLVAVRMRFPSCLRE